MFTYRLKGSLEQLDHLTPLLWDAGARGLEEKEDHILAYFLSPTELNLGGEWLETDDTDWLQRFYDTIEPVDVGSFVITPSWHLDKIDKTKIPIIIDPGMAFGTGHHETTKMALLALQKINLTDKKLLDIGSGSGILTIAAEKLGTKQSIGLDNDPITLPIAVENAKLNNATPEFRLSNGLPNIKETFNVIVANLVAELHCEFMDEYKRILSKNGQLIITGIIDDRENIVIDSLQANNLKIVDKLQQGQWVLLTLEHLM